jgi:hypothetical protein
VESLRYLTDAEAQGFAEQLAARKGTHNQAHANATSFAKPKAPKPPERPADRQARIEPPATRKF